MKLRFALMLAAISTVLVAQQAAAQTRRPRPPPDYSLDRIGRDLSRPKYRSTPHGDLSIRRENESLRGRLLGQEPIGSSLRR